MATVTLRKSPRTGEKFYQLSYVENGIQRRESLGPVTGPTAKSAREVELFRKAKEIELGGGPKIYTPAATFDAHLTEYLAWHAAEYPSSHFRVKQIAESHFGMFAGKSLPEVNDPKLIEKWKAHRRTKVAANTVAKELRTFKAVLRRAVDWNAGIDKNAAKLVAPPKVLKSTVLKIYSREQLAALYARPLWGATWKLIANTGMRRGEARKARWGDFDLRKRTVTIESTEGEGERTKSGKFRVVPLNDSALEALAALRADLGRATPHPSAYVLKRICKESLTRALVHDLDAAGLPRFPGSVVHALRHCYGSHMHMGGVPLRDLKELMGHADIKTTMIYANATEEHVHKLALAVNF